MIIIQIREHCLIDIGSKEKMNWSIRYKIALGVAEGLVYLHRGCHRRIIHRDIKAANILLTHDFSPQVRYMYDALEERQNISLIGSLPLMKCLGILDMRFWACKVAT